MHVDRAVALARKAVAEAEKGALGRADQPGKGLDLGDRKAGDRRRPFRRARLQMRFEPVPGRRCIFRDRRGRPCPSRNSTCMTAQASAPSVPGFSTRPMIGLLHRRVLVDVDDDDLGAAFLARRARRGS